MSALPDPSTAPALKDHFSANFLTGAAIEPYDLDDAVMKALIIKHCSSITAENCMKPTAIGTAEGVYDFSQADKLITFAQANGIQVRAHTLVWYQTAPDWFFAGDKTAANYKTIVLQRLERYITDVVTYFKGKVYSWDVVNEVIVDVGGKTTYREDSPWYIATGADYIETAFRAARAADPTVKLFINEYDTEVQSKRDKLVSVIQGLQTKGVPIDGVGHQMHIHATGDPDQAKFEAALTATDALGLINHVSELDVNIYPAGDFSTDYHTAANVPASIMQSQALKYRMVYSTAAAHASVKSVTTWGIADSHTWLKSVPVRLNLPLLFDEQRLPKRSFWAVVDPTFVP